MACDDGGDACHCCTCDGGDHARMPGWAPAFGRSPHYFVKPIDWRKLRVRLPKMPALPPASNIGRYVSRQVSREKSTAPLLSHRSQRKHPGIAFLTASIS